MDIFQHDFAHMAGFWQYVPRGKGKRYREIEIATINPLGGGEGADIPIVALELKTGDKLKYVYDFGIDHIIELEKIIESQKKIKYPREINDELVNMIEHLNPKLTVLTGARTSNKHPTYSTIKKMLPCQLFMTDSMGAVWLTSDGRNVEVKDWK